ncbi:nardilysin-like isoform X2 [Mya arenaria]|uniref:nardilysin-like isoform X2 n=1 Tax=Mya arenaria TaxID=6604 RepID=UPI0022E6B573|nr:nardilysin-like isoform X2 [Mya arenaria]
MLEHTIYLSKNDIKVVFMGSEKYPKENAFDDYLSRHGGHTNAWTDHERTNFYFDVDRDYFRKSLDQFAQFFVNSLLLKDAVDREIQAVDSEFQERVPSDDDRLCQIMADTAKPGHPMSKFLLGNLESLKKMPEEKNIDVYGRLRDFYERYYTAQYMTLAVHSKHNLDKLEKWTRESFSGIRNNKEPPVTFHQMKEPFDTDAFRKIYKVIAVTTTHKLYVTWPFPPLQAKYRLKPLEYISSLMNHEGEGSIYSYLKKRNWAFGVLGGNSGDGNDMNTTWSGMDMCITLTDTGIKHVHEVLQVIFSYIRLLKDAGTQEWFYRELQLTEDNKFRWKEQGDPTEYVEKMADNMQLYPPRDFLTGHRLLFQYDSQVLSDCMDNLRADNCNVMILSSDLTEADCPHREGWFGSKYNMEDITPELRQQWTSELGATQAELYLPRPNQFLCTDYTVKEVPPSEQTPLPALVSSSSQHKLFFKKDNKFLVPKGYVKYHLRSPVVFESAKSLALFDVFVSILYHNLSEPTYPALMAGYEILCAADSTQSGLTITVDGFDHKIKEVLMLIVDLLVGFSCSEEMFTAMKAEVKKGYHNTVIKPQEAASMLRWQLLEPCYMSHLDRYQVVDTLTRDSLMEFVHSFLHRITVEALVMGNFTQKEAICLHEDVTGRLPLQTCSDEPVFQEHDLVVSLPTQLSYCQTLGLNPEGTMSYLVNYYQSGPGSLRTTCLNSVLKGRMYEPCFDTLRTKKQLGYTVECINFLTYGIMGLGICVEYQASKFSESYVNGEVEGFLVEMRGILDTMTDDEFHTMIESEITARRTEDTCLEEEVGRYWAEILNLTYVFDRPAVEIGVIKTFTKQDLVDWYTQQYLGNYQRKVSIQVVGKQSQRLAECKHLEDTDHTVKCLVDPDQAGAVAIENIQKFRNSLKTFPYTKITT